MMSVRIIDKAADWDALAAEWNRLLAESGFDSVFLTFEWLRSWWRHFADPGESLYIVAVMDGERLRAAAPLFRRVDRTMYVPVRALRSMTNPHTPKYDWLCRADDEPAMTALCQALRSRRDWDMIQLDYVPAESPASRLLSSAARGMGWRVATAPCIRSPYVTITGTWGAYYGSLSSKFRSNTRYAERKLREMGALEVTELRDGAGLAAVLEEAFTVEQSSWKGEAGSAIADRPHEKRFYTEFAEAAADRRWFRLYALRIDGRMIAFDYCVDYGGTMSLVKIGYDPALAKQSPGTVLRAKVLEGLFEEGGRHTYDMLGSDSDWKMRWTDKVHVLESLHLYRSGVRGAAIYQLHHGVRERLDDHPRVKTVLKNVKARLMRQ